MPRDQKSLFNSSCKSFSFEDYVGANCCKFLDNAYKHAKLLFYIVIRISCFSDHFRLETLPRNLGDSFVSLLFESIAGKNVSPSDKKKIVAIFEKRLRCREIAV